MTRTISKNQTLSMFSAQPDIHNVSMSAIILNNEALSMFNAQSYILLPISQQLFLLIETKFNIPYFVRYLEKVEKILKS